MHGRIARFLALGTLLILAGAAEARAQQAVFVVRHAERADQSNDPPLADAGRARATALAALLRDAGVTHVFTSEYRRTRETAAPIAEARALTIDPVAAREGAALVAKVRGAGRDAVVLVVAHSNTIPPLLTALGSAARVELEDRHYDDVFVLVPREGRSPAMVRLKYGQPTP